MRPEVNSNQFEISNRFEKAFLLHDNFTVSNLKSSKRFQKLSRLLGSHEKALLIVHNLFINYLNLRKESIQKQLLTAVL